MKKLKKCPDELLSGLIRLTALAVLTVAGLAGGCATTGPRGDLAPRSPEGPAMDLAQGLFLRGESLQTMAVRGSVSHEARGHRKFFRFEALFLKPDRLLFTAFDPAGRPAFRLAAALGQLNGLVYGTKQYFTGPATAENLARFLPLDLTLEQLAALLSGSVVRPGAAGARALAENTELILVPAEIPEDENEIWRLRVAGGLDQDPRRAVILSAARGPAGRPNLKLRYPTVRDLPRADDHEALEPFPASVEAEWVQDKQFLRLTYDQVSLGQKLDPDLFLITPPVDFETVLLP